MTDEAKRCVEALRICHSKKDCRDCKFIDSEKDEMSCVNVLFVSAADLIESLSAELEQVKQERDGLNVLLGQAQSMLETRTRERDAAVNTIKALGACKYCAHNALCKDMFPQCDVCTKLQCPCHSCFHQSNWQWRGGKGGR